MRDGVKLFTSVYVPKDVFTDGKTYPIMLQRTPYNVAPYGVDQYRATSALRNSSSARSSSSSIRTSAAAS